MWEPKSMNDESNDRSNEAAALADVLTWSANVPGWQRDALHLLCRQTKLESADVTALVPVCKGDSPAVTLDTCHFRDPAASHTAVSLGALHGVANVNALPPGERRSFGKTGLTVIYGDNGATKSGYARVLKLSRACSPKGDAILPKIYADSSGIATASIDFFVGGQKRSAKWNQGGSADSMQSAVSRQPPASTRERPTSMSRTPTISPTHRILCAFSPHRAPASRMADRQEHHYSFRQKATIRAPGLLTPKEHNRNMLAAAGEDHKILKVMN